VQPSVHGDAAVSVLCAVGSLSAELKENLILKAVFKKCKHPFMQLLGRDLQLLEGNQAFEAAHT